MIVTGQKKQHGVITLMGALFILVTLTVMGQAISRMTTSSITDTAVQNDAVEALFIAESGIEYTSYFYANGSSRCDDLKNTIGTIASGRGSFSVTDSIIINTDCSITVQARVSSTGRSAPDTSQRTIIARLRLNTDEVRTDGNGHALNGTVSLVRWHEVISN